MDNGKPRTTVETIEDEFGQPVQVTVEHTAWCDVDDHRRDINYGCSSLPAQFPITHEYRKAGSRRTTPPEIITSNRQVWASADTTIDGEPCIVLDCLPDYIKFSELDGFIDALTTIRDLVRRPDDGTPAEPVDPAPKDPGSMTMNEIVDRHRRLLGGL